MIKIKIKLFVKILLLGISLYLAHCINYICCACGPQCLYNLSTCIIGDITY